MATVASQLTILNFLIVVENDNWETEHRVSLEYLFIIYLDKRKMVDLLDTGFSSFNLSSL